MIHVKLYQVKSKIFKNLIFGQKKKICRIIGMKKNNRINHSNSDINIVHIKLIY